MHTFTTSLIVSFYYDVAAGGGESKVTTQSLVGIDNVAECYHKKDTVILLKRIDAKVQV